MNASADFGFIFDKASNSIIRNPSFVAAADYHSLNTFDSTLTEEKGNEQD